MVKIEYLYKKVVTWKKKPNYYDLISYFVCSCLGLVGDYAIMFIDANFSSIHILWGFVITCGILLFFVGSIYMIYSFVTSFGKGRKVYWRRVKLK